MANTPGFSSKKLDIEQPGVETFQRSFPQDSGKFCTLFNRHYAVTAFSAGGLSHVFADSLTIMGVPLGWWSDRKYHLFGGRLRTGNMGEYWVAGAVVLLCFGFSMVTRGWGNMGYAPFFTDWADCYKQGLCSAAEWKANRFKWF